MREDFFEFIKQSKEETQESAIKSTQYYAKAVYAKRINWAAFLFGPYWLVYRRMYGLGLLVFVLELFIDRIPYIVFPDLSIYMDALFISVHLLLVGLYFGFKGNDIYFNHIELRQPIQKGVDTWSLLFLLIIGAAIVFIEEFFVPTVEPHYFTLLVLVFLFLQQLYMIFTQDTVSLKDSLRCLIIRKK